MNKTGQKGFTLIELMVTVAIVGVLGAIAIPIYNNYITKTRIADALAHGRVYAGKVAIDREERIDPPANLEYSEIELAGSEENPRVRIMLKANIASAVLIGPDESAGGKVIVLSEESSDASVRWVCTTNLPQALIPEGCTHEEGVKDRKLLEEWAEGEDACWSNARANKTGNGWSIGRCTNCNQPRVQRNIAQGGYRPGSANAYGLGCAGLYGGDVPLVVAPTQDQSTEDSVSTTSADSQTSSVGSQPSSVDPQTSGSGAGGKADKDEADQVTAETTDKDEAARVAALSDEEPAQEGEKSTLVAPLTPPDVVEPETEVTDDDPGACDFRQREERVKRSGSTMVYAFPMSDECKRQRPDLYPNQGAQSRNTALKEREEEERKKQMAADGLRCEYEGRDFYGDGRRLGGKMGLKELTQCMPVIDLSTGTVYANSDAARAAGITSSDGTPAWVWKHKHDALNDEGREALVAEMARKKQCLSQGHSWVWGKETLCGPNEYGFDYRYRRCNRYRRCSTEPSERIAADAGRCKTDWGMNGAYVDSNCKELAANKKFSRDNCVISFVGDDWCLNRFDPNNR